MEPDSPKRSVMPSGETSYVPRPLLKDDTIRAQLAIPWSSWRSHALGREPSGPF